MPEFVRVRLANGSEASIPAAHAERADLTPLDKKPALNRDGSLAPTKPRVAKGAAAATTKSGASASTDAHKEG